jgi:hypothetical protein
MGPASPRTATQRPGEGQTRAAYHPLTDQPSATPVDSDCTLANPSIKIRKQQRPIRAAGSDDQQVIVTIPTVRYVPTMQNVRRVARDKGESACVDPSSHLCVYRCSCMLAFRYIVQDAIASTSLHRAWLVCSMSRVEDDRLHVPVAAERDARRSYDIKA